MIRLGRLGHYTSRTLPRPKGVPNPSGDRQPASQSSLAGLYSLVSPGRARRYQMEETNYLPISSLAEIVYCPCRFYYRVVEAADETNEHVLEGKLQEEQRNERLNVNREHVSQTRAVRVASDRLGLSGIIDAIETGSSLYPVEYKKGPLSENLNDDVQVCAQAMVLEEATGQSIEVAYVHYVESACRREVRLDEALRDLVLKTIGEARSIMASGEIPPPLNDNRCNGCALVPRCLPAEVGYLKYQRRPPASPVPAVNLGRVLYVDEPGAYVRKRGERVVVTKDDEVIREIPACNLDQVVLVGNVNMSTPMIQLMMDRNLEVAYLSGSGTYAGSYLPGYTKNSVVRIAQYRTHLDTNQRLHLATRFVWGKLANMRTILVRNNRDRGDLEVARAAERLGRMVHKAREARDLASLLGIEGSGSREYFQVFGKLLKPGTSFSFERRTRRPPADPVNSMLGFGYSLLAKDMVAAVSVAGMDPYVGFYHEAKYGRPALALDLMEEFRSIIVDSAVITLVNRGMIDQDDFEERLGGCFLNKSGRRKFFQAYEGRRGEEVTHPLFGYRLPYRRNFELQARLLAKVLSGELPEYFPMRVR